MTLPPHDTYKKLNVECFHDAIRMSTNAEIRPAEVVSAGRISVLLLHWSGFSTKPLYSSHSPDITAS